MPVPNPDSLRRQFRLPAEDEAFLDSLGLPWEAIAESGQRWVIVYGMPVPAGYTATSVDVAIMMAPGYPPGPLDMAYFNPTLTRQNNVSIRNADGQVTIDGKSWQAWSRHRQADNAWAPGEDNLESHYFYMRAWLADELRR